MIMLANCVKELQDKIQSQEKLTKAPEVLGFRLIDGPWENTKFLDVETNDKQYSGLLIANGSTLSMVAPFKVTKKDIKK